MLNDNQTTLKITYSKHLGDEDNVIQNFIKKRQLSRLRHANDE